MQQLTVNRFVRSLLVLLSLVIVSSAQLSNFFSRSDVSQLYSRATSQLQQAASIRDAYYAVSILKSQSDQQPLNCNCGQLQKLLDTSSSAYDIYYGLVTSKVCNCELALDTNSMLAVAKKATEASDIYSLAGGVLASKELGGLSADASVGVIEKVLSLMEPDGKFKSSPNSDKSTLENLHYVLEMLSAFSIDQNIPTIAADVFEKAFQLIPDGEGDSESDVLLIVPLSQLTDKKLRLVGTRLLIVTELLLSLAHSDDIAVLSKVHEAIRIVSSYKASPLHISLEQPALPVADAAAQLLTLKVVDVYGDPLECDSIEVASIKAIGTEAEMYKGVAFKGTSLALADSVDSALAAGSYLLSLSIKVAGRQKPLSFETHFVVTQEVAINDVLVGMADVDGEVAGDMISISAENALSSSALTASAVNGESIRVEYIVSAVDKAKTLKAPHQSFVRLANLSTGKSVFAVGVVVDPESDSSSSSKHITYTATFSLADDIGKFDHSSGTYTLSILVGDACIAKAVEFTAGAVELLFPAKQQVTLPIYAKALLHTSDTTMTTLPEIEHMMRPDAKRASSFMAATFTLLSWLPLAAFLLVVISLQPNLNRLKSVSSIGFVACLAAAMCLYVSYWLALDGVSFYQTIKYLCILFPVTAVVGRYALMSVAEVRAAEKSKEA